MLASRTNVCRWYADLASASVSLHDKPPNRVQASKHAGCLRDLTSLQSLSNLGAAYHHTIEGKGRYGLHSESTLGSKTLQQLFIAATILSKHMIVTNEEVLYPNVPYDNGRYEVGSFGGGEFPREWDDDRHIHTISGKQLTAFVDIRQKSKRLAAFACKDDLRVRIKGHHHNTLVMLGTNTLHQLQNADMSKVDTVERPHCDGSGLLKRHGIGSVAHDRHATSCG
jgi:hypothetical protein